MSPAPTSTAVFALAATPLAEVDLVSEDVWAVATAAISNQHTIRDFMGSGDVIVHPNNPQHVRLTGHGL
jgi:hypothetical protein